GSSCRPRGWSRHGPRRCWRRCSWPAAWSRSLPAAGLPASKSQSKYQANPRLATFEELICLSGLKCFESLVRPFISQLTPVTASAAMRSSLTSPGFVTAGAAEDGEKCSATAAAIARRTRVRPRIRRASIPCTSLNLTYAPLWLRKVRALLTGADLPLVMLGAPVKESQRVPYNEGTPACEFAARW